MPPPEECIACPLCKEVVSYAGISKHLFSKKHSETLRLAILKDNRRSDLLLASRLPLLRREGSDNDFHLCLGCSKSWCHARPDHLATCREKEKHRSILDAWLSGQSVSSPSKAMEAEVEAYKKKIASLEKELEKAKEGEEWEKKEREALEEEFETFKEESGIEELKSENRILMILLGRLVGLENKEELRLLESSLKNSQNGPYSIENPFVDVRSLLS